MVIEEVLVRLEKVDPSLTSIRLTGFGLNPDNVLKLCESLKNNSTVHTLDFMGTYSWCEHTDGPALVNAFVSLLSANSNIQEFRLRKFDFHGSNINEFATMLSANRALGVLFLDENNLSDSGASLIADGLRTNKKLHTLGLTGNSIGLVGAQRLADLLDVNETLRTINISRNRIEGAGAAVLANALMNNSSVTNINLSSNHIGQDSFKLFTRMLEMNESIHTVNLSGNNIGDYGATFIADALSKNTKVHTLMLHGNGIGFIGGHALSKMLERNATLQVIDLSKNEIGDKGVVQLSKSLCQNSKLQELNLSDNKIYNIECFADGLATNSSLRNLCLKNNQISGVTRFASMIGRNSALWELDISINQLTYTDAANLSASLVSNNSLFAVDLHGNTGFGFSYASNGFCEMIQKNKCLVVFNIGLDAASNEYKSIRASLLTNRLRAGSLPQQWFNRNITKLDKTVTTGEVLIQESIVVQVVPYIVIPTPKHVAPHEILSISPYSSTRKSDSSSTFPIDPIKSGTEHGYFPGQSGQRGASSENAPQASYKRNN